ncbi:TetR/AcrR family transcriptional regulator [Bacillus sp. ISL-18]|uniref:TetR/AcrR family transcriptional regulator n=1 Tax=Bacillus sp. ISL-18 TaxID=2819118 RepID=UPI001BE7BDED|nr:TetR/AcrR family transcriptional regulator [Bacillus sp. ISL-18]MBT2658340.1 TetR/AcrR family transcriptional regulator [Bacillus sp. ISL-18]
MNERKQHVINKAHQLFIDKGFQATSIQEIIDYSGISKGTFYNYFSSKNELLMAIFTYLSQRIEHERNELLIGQDISDIEIFTRQIELQMAFNRRNKLFTLFEEVFVSNDPTLKEFLKRMQIMYLDWIFNRFVDIFGKNKHPFLLDCAIMFMGLMHHNIHFHFLAKESDANIKQVIRYSVNRIEKMVEEVENSGEQLLEPEILEKWLPNCNPSSHEMEKKLLHTILRLKKCVGVGEVQFKNNELLDFIQEEMLHSKTPRRFLIKSALASLNDLSPSATFKQEMDKLEQLLEEFFLN